MSKYKVGLMLVIILMATLIGNSFTLGYGVTNSGYNINFDEEETTRTPLKSETVFSMLDYDGSVIETRVLNRLSGYVSSEYDWIIDYGRYSQVKNLTSSAEGYRMDDRVFWPAEILQDGDIYYEGYTDQPLPVKVEVSYRLDGEEVKADKLLGNSGKLEIILSFENLLVEKKSIEFMDSSGKRESRLDQNYIPLVVQGTIPLDLRNFSDIAISDGAVIEVGRTANVSFMMFPYPTAEAVISARGTDIELEPISITVMPQMPPLNEIEMSEDLKELLDGLETVQGGMEDLYAGILEINKGTSEADQGIEELLVTLMAGLSFMEEGMLGLAGGMEELNNGLMLADEGFSELFTGLADGTDEIALGLMALYDASNQVLFGLEEMSNQIDSIIEPATPALEGIEEMLHNLESLEMEKIVPILQDMVELMDELQIWIKEEPEDELLHSLNRFNVDLKISSDQMVELESLLEGLISSNEDVLVTAQLLIDENPEGSELYELGVSLIAQGKQVEALDLQLENMKQSLVDLQASGINLGDDAENIIGELINKVEEILAEIADQNGLDPSVYDDLFEYLRSTMEYIDQVQQTLPIIQEQINDIKSLPFYLDQLVEGQRMIRDGIKRIHDEGVLELKNGIQQAEAAFSLKGILEAVGVMNFGAKTLLEQGFLPMKAGVNLAQQQLSLAPLVNAQEQIAVGMSKLIYEGIQPMRSGLKSGVDELLFAEEKLRVMEDLSETYRSFADNENNSNSSVKFIMQTPSVTAKDEASSDADKEKAEETALQKLIARFTALFRGE